MTIPSIDQIAAAEALAAADANAAVTAPLVGSASPDFSASIVNFSPLAQLLSTTALFQAQQAAQAQQTPASTSTSNGFQQLADTATLFVNAFNNFQASSTDSLVNPLGAAFENDLLQEIHAQSTPSGAGNTQSFIGSLAEVGINFQEASNPIHPNQFQVDSTALQTAFTANPAQTSTVLSNALQGLSAIEEKLILAQSTTGQDQFTTQLNMQNSVDAQATAALQPLLAEEALTVALETNLAVPQTATTPPTPPAPATAVTNTTVVSPGAVAVAEAAANVVAANAAASAAPTAATIAAPTAANTIVDLEIANTTTAAAAASANVAQTAMTPTPIDPLIAVAVAAYRAGEAIASIPADKILINPATDAVQDVVPTDRVNPITSSPNDRTGNDARNQTAYTTIRKNGPNRA